MEQGLNLWDTAAVYGMGSSETILGSFVKNTNRDEVIVSTKFTPQIAGMYNNSMSDMLNASMERIGTDYIDIYWIHNPQDVEKWTPELIPLAKSGKIKAIGVSNHNLEEIKLAQSILNKEGLKIDAVQNHFSLLNRTSEFGGILDYCKENDIIFFSYMVLEQGALSGKYNSMHPFPEGSDRARTYNPMLSKIEGLIEVMKEIGDRYNASVAQIATAWAIGKGTVPIVGVTKVAQVNEAVKTSEIKLTENEIKLLEEAADNINISTIREWEKSMDV